MLEGKSTGANMLGSHVNDAGDVVGTASDTEQFSSPDRAFFYSGGKMRDLGTLGGPWSRAAAVNNAGQVIGTSANDSGESRAFLYTSGRMQDLSARVPGGQSINPLDINERGDITGTWVVDDETRAFLYAQGTWTDLGDIGGMNAFGRRLNDRDWVTGDAIRADNRDAPSDTHQMAGAFQLLHSNDLIWSRRQRHYLLVRCPRRLRAASLMGCLTGAAW